MRCHVLLIHFFASFLSLGLEPCQVLPIYLQVFLSDAKGPALCEDDGLYNGFDMDEIDLSIENYKEFFGVTHNNPEQLFDDGLFGTKDISESNCLGAYAAEVIQ